MRRLTVVFGLIFLFGVACQNESKAAGIISYSRDPYIGDIELAKHIISGYPSGITQFFDSGDTVNIWILWSSSVDSHLVTTKWYDPDSNFVDSSSVKIPPGDNIITIFSLRVYQRGEWHVNVFVDRTDFRAGLVFYVDTLR